MMDRVPTIGWSDFALNNSTKAKGNSYTTLSLGKVVDLVQKGWDSRIPGDGESDRTRKVLVRVPSAHFFCPLTVKLTEGLPLQAEVVRRQEGEELHIEVFITPTDATRFGAALQESPADNVEVVCYSAVALLEDGGYRSTDCEWEIVALQCSKNCKAEPMSPLTMARNQLRKPGGTVSHYTSQQYAEAIWFDCVERGIKVRPARQR